MPIHVGAACSDCNLDIPTDATGDNISAKNPNYCELTGLYWAWKNMEPVEYIGLSHYRRYFNFRTPRFCYDVHNMTPEGMVRSGFADPDMELIRRYDMILPKPARFSMSMDEQYRKWTLGEPLDVLAEVLKEKYPEYLPAFRQVMRGNRLSCYNMFITRWQIFQDYAEWLFDVLDEVAERTTIPEDPYQARFFGFLSERLLHAYAVHHHLKVKHLQVVMLNEKPRNKSLFRRFLRYARKELIFRLSRLRA